MSNSQSHVILGALAAARAERPELAKLLLFYQDLFGVQLAARAQLPAYAAPESQAVQKRAEAGLPQLAFTDLRLEETPFGALVARVRDVLVHHGVGDAPSERSDPGSSPVRRAQYLFENWPMLTAPDKSEAVDLGDDLLSDPLWDQAIALALVPYLQHAAEAVLPALEQARWGRPICPACGGQPNLALLEPERGGRQLVCSRCDAVWAYTRVGCPYCRSQEKQTYFLGQGGRYRLYVCPTCRRYLKTVDLREAGRPVVPAVERLLSVSMDLSARREGYVG